MSSASEVTQLLRSAQQGDPNAVARLLPVVYEELRQLASRQLRRERADHTLQPTALVHEVFMKLVGQANAKWQNRSQFFAVAAQAMRRVLVDYARGFQAAKRGGGQKPIAIDGLVLMSERKPAEVLAIDAALHELANIDPLQSEIVELRFFGGMTIEETAEVLNISPATVKREWTTARAWLYRALSE